MAVDLSAGTWNNVCLRVPTLYRENLLTNLFFFSRQQKKHPVYWRSALYWLPKLDSNQRPCGYFTTSFSHCSLDFVFTMSLLSDLGTPCKVSTHRIIITLSLARRCLIFRLRIRRISGVFICRFPCNAANKLTAACSTSWAIEECLTGWE